MILPSKIFVWDGYGCERFGKMQLFSFPKSSFGEHKIACENTHWAWFMLPNDDFGRSNDFSDASTRFGLRNVEKHSERFVRPSKIFVWGGIV